MADHPIPSRSEAHLFARGEPRGGLFRFFPPATHAELWGGLALFLLSLVGAIWVFKCRSKALALEQDSVNVEGKVVRLWITTANNGRRHRVEYEYTASSAAAALVFRKETILPKEHFDQLKEGGPVAVKVCPTDPANHQVLGEPGRVFAGTASLAFCIGLLALLALAGGINVWWWWISSRKLGPDLVFVLKVKNVY